jgi:hypothetical protein
MHLILTFTHRIWISQTSSLQSIETEHFCDLLPVGEAERCAVISAPLLEKQARSDQRTKCVFTYAKAEVCWKSAQPSVGCITSDRFT